MKTLKTLKAQLLADPDTRDGLTQADVAERMGTTHKIVARLEGGKAAPSLRSLQRSAQAVGARAVVRFERSRAA